MTKRNKPTEKQLYAALIVLEHEERGLLCDHAIGPNEPGCLPNEYRDFIRSQSHKNNVYAMALREIGG